MPLNVNGAQTWNSYDWKVHEYVLLPNNKGFFFFTVTILHLEWRLIPDFHDVDWINTKICNQI